jgi:IS30 family transposase
MINRLTLLATKVRTLTYDNGKEFAEHAAVDKALGSTSYFADPYSSWKRGSNENLNGRIRQYIPKSRPLSTVRHAEFAKIERLLNYRLRKRLGYKIPHEIFTNSLNRVALRS